MTCAEFTDILSRCALTGVASLTASEILAAERHAGGCEDCLALCRCFAAVWDMGASPLEQTANEIGAARIRERMKLARLNDPELR